MKLIPPSNALLIIRFIDGTEKSRPINVSRLESLDVVATQVLSGLRNATRVVVRKADQRGEAADGRDRFADKELN